MSEQKKRDYGNVVTIVQVPEEAMKKLDILSRCVTPATKKQAILTAIDKLAEHPEFKAKFKALAG